MRIFIQGVVKLSLKERQNRLKAIKKLIRSFEIESQESLLEHLKNEGFDVTQATLSRDLKVLKVGKISNGKEGYVYMLSDNEDIKETGRTFANDFLRGYISIKWSGNMVVIKTHSGYSDSVAMAIDKFIDNFNLDCVLGTISGRDNTVFAVLKEGINGEVFFNDLKKYIPELEENKL